MKYGTSKLIGADCDAFIKVTFEGGVDNPSMHFEGLHVDGCGSPHGAHICMLEAAANMLIEKCEQMKGKGNTTMAHAAKFDWVTK